MARLVLLPPPGPGEAFIVSNFDLKCIYEELSFHTCEANDDEDGRDLD